LTTNYKNSRKTWNIKKILNLSCSQKIEDLIDELKQNYTIVIVTHNMQQAARVSQKTAFLLMESFENPSTLIEYDDTNKLFTNSKDKRTEDYIMGRFG